MKVIRTREFCATCGRYTTHYTRDGVTVCDPCDERRYEAEAARLMADPRGYDEGDAMDALGRTVAGRARND